MTAPQPPGEDRGGVADPMKGWRLDDGCCWVFVRAATRGQARQQALFSERDVDAFFALRVTRVPALDGTGPRGVVPQVVPVDHAGFWTCEACGRYTMVGPCRHHGEDA